MKNRTENISVRYRPQHLTKSPFILLICRARKPFNSKNNLF